MRNETKSEWLKNSRKKVRMGKAEKGHKSRRFWGASIEIRLWPSLHEFRLAIIIMVLTYDHGYAYKTRRSRRVRSIFTDCPNFKDTSARDEPIANAFHSLSLSLSLSLLHVLQGEYLYSSSILFSFVNKVWIEEWDRLVLKDNILKEFVP